MGSFMVLLRTWAFGSVRTIARSLPASAVAQRDATGDQYDTRLGETIGAAQVPKPL